MSMLRVSAGLIVLGLIPVCSLCQLARPSGGAPDGWCGPPPVPHRPSTVRDAWEALRAEKVPHSQRSRARSEVFSSRGVAEEMPLVWANYFASEEAAGVEEAYAGAVDVSGNAYVTGSSTRLPFGSDYLTVKLGPGGNLLWAVRYGGHAEGENIAWAVTVDGLGNVYVTGESPDPYFTDIATIKYNALGVQQWVARWGGETGLHDAGASIVVDGAGNVYVAGRSMGEDRYDDAVLLSYSPQGEERWSRRYDGPPGTTYWNEAVPGLALLPSGAVCAAMTTTGADSSEDLLVVCLDADGGELWSDQFTGPAGSDNSFQALAVDPSGALIVGGTSDGWGNAEDYLLLRYGLGGYREWDAHFDGPGSDGGDLLVDIATDASGNVYACGLVDDNTLGAALLALDRYGNQEWVQYLNVPTGGVDLVEGVIHVPPNAVRLVGETMPNDPFAANELFVMEFDTLGNPQWDARATPSGCSLAMVTGSGSEPTGASYVVALLDNVEERENYGVMKVGPGGGILYETQYDGPGTSYDQVLAGWVHPSGALSLGGWTQTGSGNVRARTVRFAADGTLQWVQQYYSPTDSSAAVLAVTGDAAGNTYVTGFTYEALSDLDIVTIKYTPEGTEEWKDRLILLGPDIPAGIAADDSGNVYVVGTVNAYSGSSTFEVLKYGPDGSRLWQKAISVPSGASNSAQAVAALPGGGVCFAGDSWEPGHQRQMATVFLNPDGTYVTALHTSPSGYAASATDIAVSDLGVVYVAGSEPDAAAHNNPLLVRYSPQGVEDWSLVVLSGGTWEAFDRALVLSGGDVQLLGHIQPDAFQNDLLVMRVGPDGRVAWRVEYGSEFGGDDSPASLCCDSTGDVYVTASCQTPQTMSDDCIVLRYDGLGILKEIGWFPGPGTSLESPVVSGVDQGGDLLVGGTERGARWNWSVMRAMKFSTSPTAVDPESQGAPVRYQLAQNFPNPFNPVTTIRLAVPERSRVRLSVYDILGQRVATVLDRMLEAGVHAVEFDAARLPSGVYVYTMRAGTFIASRKMVVLR